MSELIDKYGTNIKQIYGEDIAKINQVEGFVYGVPNQIERGSIPAVFMRKDLVEKYNIDTTQIKEPKDLESVFETVKAGEPDMTMLYSSSENDAPATRLFRGDTLSDNNYLGVLMDQTNSTKLETSLRQTGLKIQLPCCMTGIRRDISARMQEPTQRTGEQYARLEIYFHCFFLSSWNTGRI